MLQLNFEKLIIHNFLSYGHVEVPLKGNNYCMVSGINHNPLDNATSNGSGKSSWASAICFALTGQTIQGLSSNIKNINVEEDSCWVELTLKVNEDTFVITRQKNPKALLKIFLNGEDISGKGLRESEVVLAKHLPDLNSQLLSSIVILGQGLPNKFTANTPSGRKEVLERLSKSDFMIQDLKERIASRSEELAKDLRANEDEMLVKNTSEKVLLQQLATKEAALKVLEAPKDFDNIIQDCTSQRAALYTRLQDLKKCCDAEELHAKQQSEIVHNEDLRKQQYISQENATFAEVQRVYAERKGQLNASLESLKKQIAQMKQIRDICPTCGQKIPGVLKPDTSALEAETQGLYTQLQELSARFFDNKAIHEKELQNLEKDSALASAQARKALQEAVDKKHLYTTEFSKCQDTYNKNEALLTKTQLEKSSYEASLNQLRQEVLSLQEQLKEIAEKKLYINNKHDEISSHTKVISQMNTLIKRDFRGYLLQDIINFIEGRARIYAAELFGSSDLVFTLNGNNIEIAYCNKTFENLSGGEQQKVDLIIQFSIRDMMQQYLGFSSNILVLDEIFDALDMQGCNRVLNLIAKYFTDLDSVYIISHRADELEIPYDSEFVVVKNEQGISTILYH